MALPIRVEAGKNVPIYRQIHDQLKDLIYSNQLPSGTPLPSIRALAQDLGCSVITTRRAYQDLESEGLIVTQQGRGTFVAEVEDPRRESHRQETLRQTLQEAIDHGLRMDFSIREIRAYFEEGLKHAGSPHHRKQEEDKR
ncbi:GntR family transcriptional regulator [Desmospora profundinema]|uniref:GntR family transcriptional regulator n=1 Tax=Desmospora profundinema TaxID=1571184 RepID=A0ABU1INK9_9BACL|nr:GntR family transcriptional regulator [Desmospora profundinema]MDR6225355.1 GntR family transcriptional regulator [Desmospora profundinema]